MPSIKKLLQAAAGNAGESLYVEDVFSTYLYTGTGAAQTITNGIDLDGEGGLVWLKARDLAEDHEWFDTERGAGKYIMSSANNAEGTASNFSSFNSDGWSFNATGRGNYSGYNYASWTFRKAEKFFDVVTYTGTGSARTVAHNLGSVPGMIIVKGTDIVENWIVYHRSLGATHYIQLNTTGAGGASSIAWNNTEPTSTEFTVNTFNAVNEFGYNYVAYVFAHEAGGFGDDESIIKCGSFTETGSDVEVDLGFEPQWLMIKRYDGVSNWFMYDTMRGFTWVDGSNAYLQANTSSVEDTQNAYFKPTATGFIASSFAGSGADWIYIAIRRPMKTPESGTEVFATDTRGSTGDGNAPTYRSPFPVDMQFNRNRTYAGGDTTISARLTQASQMFTNLINAENANAAMMFDYMNGVQTDTGTNTNQSAWMFKRATGFFDVVAYTGDGTGARAIPHNLGVVPEWVIFKRRENSENWYNYHDKNLSPNANWWLNYLILDNTNATASSSSFDEPNNANINLASNNFFNGSGKEYIVYLFATLAGVSKVGSYTGTAADLNVDCGFSAGARFILIKRTDSTGDWYYWDSERGIVAGNDPYLLLNSTAAEVTGTDYIDPLASGFTVTSSAPAALNASGGTYIFLAIA
jgi:hypothetical protein